MTHRITRLTNEHSDAYVNKLITNNVQLNETDYDPELIITDYRTVLKPNGELLLKLLPGAISVELASVAFREFNAAKLNVSTNSLRAAINTSANRGSDAVLGFMDPVPLFDFCRATAFTAKEMKAFRASLPFIRATAELMKIHTPDKYAAQMAACQNCLPDYIIPGTPYSTVTINRDTTATCHMDKGDYKPGIGVITVVWAKRVGNAWHIVVDNPAQGGCFVFPKYGVAVWLRTGDVLLCDVHEAHGVTEILGKAGDWARMSFVCYLRELMFTCGTPAEEMAKVAIKDTAKYEAMAAKR